MQHNCAALSALAAALFPAGCSLEQHIVLRHVLLERLQELEHDPALQPWSLRAMGLRSERTMVGHIGFHTAPNAPYLAEFVPDGVEFGYTVFAAHNYTGRLVRAASGGAWFQFTWNRAHVQVLPGDKRVLVRIYSARTNVAQVFDADSVSFTP